MTDNDLRDALNIMLTNFGKPFDENIAALWKGMFLSFDAAIFKKACLEIITTAKFFPKVSELIDEYQRIKAKAEHDRYEALRAEQRLLTGKQGYCYLCNNTGFCYHEKGIYEFSSRCICAHGKDLGTFSEAQIKADYEPSSTKSHTERDKKAIKSGRNPFYWPTIKEALGEGFVIYEARMKEKYLTTKKLTHQEKTDALNQMAFETMVNDGFIEITDDAVPF